MARKLVIVKEMSVDSRFSDKIENLRSTFLTCREKGHSWKHVTDKTLITYRNQVRQISREWTCGSCQTGCVELIHVPSFAIESRKYSYPDGYLLSRAVTNGKRVDVKDIRREVCIRAGLVKR